MQENSTRRSQTGVWERENPYKLLGVPKLVFGNEGEYCATIFR